MRKTDIAGSSLLSDKAYGTKEILAYIEEYRVTVIIPPKNNVKEPWLADYYLYKERHLAECFSRRFNGFAALLQGMINWICLSLLLCI